MQFLRDDMRVNISLTPPERVLVQSQEEATTEESKINCNVNSCNKDIKTPTLGEPFLSKENQKALSCSILYLV